MHQLVKLFIACIVSLSLFFSVGCATTNAGGSAFTSEQVMLRCVGSGALAYGVCLALKGDEKRCLAAAVGGCAVWLAYNNARDKERLAALRQRTLEQGVAQQDEWNGDDGNLRKASFTPGADFPLASARESGVVCRPLKEDLSASAGTVSNNSVYCRNRDGTWVPQSSVSI